MAHPVRILLVKGHVGLKRASEVERENGFKGLREEKRVGEGELGDVGGDA